MKKLITTVSIVAIAASLASCSFIKVINDGSGKRSITRSSNSATRYYEMEDFNSIRLDCNADFTYSMAEGAPVVSITAAGNIIDSLIVEVVNGELRIQFNNKRRFKHCSLDVDISSSKLNRIEANGAADIEIKPGLLTDKLEIAVNGACDAEIDDAIIDVLKADINGAGEIDIDNITSGYIDLTVNGAGDASISGNAVKGRFTINGAGNVDIRELRIGEVETRIMGAGSVSRK